jgi:hypothetical protein
MANRGESVRSMVARWLVPDPEKPTRVTQFRSRRSTRDCYVSVQAVWAGGQVAIFFRHQDGSWHVNPPASERATTCIPDTGQPDGNRL